MGGTVLFSIVYFFLVTFQCTPGRSSMLVAFAVCEPLLTLNESLNSGTIILHPGDAYQQDLPKASRTPLRL